MFNYCDELFLKEYFLFRTTVGRYLPDGELLRCLSAIYMLSEEKRNALNLLINCEAVREIDSVNEYRKFLRVKQYCEIVGIRPDYTEEEVFAITVKAEALTFAEKHGLSLPDDATRAAIYERLTEKADSGLVDAARIWGILQCEGLFVAQDTVSGRKKLSRAARWNDIDGILALLQYGCEKQWLIDRLKTLTDGTPHGELVAKAEARHNLTAGDPVPECKLLAKAFGQGKLKRQQYVPQYANLLSCEILNLQDKEKIVLSDDKGMQNELADLPLKLTLRDIPYNSEALQLLGSHTKYRERILQAAKNNDLRATDYRSLGLTFHSDYMLNFYFDVIAKMFSGANVVRLEIADLNEQDFEPSKHNVFVRNCNGEKDNVFVLVFRGEIRETVLKEAVNFVNNDKRTKLRLLRPNVVLNLGAVLPVCLADGENGKTLQEVCDIVDIGKPTKAEKTELLREILSQKQKFYEVTVSLDDGVQDKLVCLELDEMNTVLDKWMCNYRRCGNSVVLTVEELDAQIKNVKISKVYGFGGGFNEVR